MVFVTARTCYRTFCARTCSSCSRNLLAFRYVTRRPPNLACRLSRSRICASPCPSPVLWRRPYRTHRLFASRRQKARSYEAQSLRLKVSLKRRDVARRSLLVSLDLLVQLQQFSSPTVSYLRLALLPLLPRPFYPLRLPQHQRLLCLKLRRAGYSSPPRRRRQRSAQPRSPHHARPWPQPQSVQLQQHHSHPAERVQASAQNNVKGNE